jgi:hypothetical protein
VTRSSPGCVFCGRAATTRDHVPPKGVFLDPLPTDLVTVPACEVCNSSTRLDDEYFRTLVATQGYWNVDGKRLWKEKVVGSSFRKSPKFRQMLARNIIELPPEHRRIDLPGGVKAITFDGPRINRVLRKIVLGLYWHHEGQRLPTDISIEPFKDHRLDEPTSAIFRSGREHSIGGGAFRYRFGITFDDPRVSIWLLTFYEMTNFAVAVGVRTLEAEI